RERPSVVLRPEPADSSGQRLGERALQGYVDTPRSSQASSQGAGRGALSTRAAAGDLVQLLALFVRALLARVRAISSIWTPRFRHSATRSAPSGRPGHPERVRRSA